MVFLTVETVSLLRTHLVDDILVDDIYSQRNKSQQDVVSEALTNFHPNIKLTIEVNPVKFLDSKIILSNEGVVTTQVYRKENKTDVPWVSKTSKRYKRDTISWNLHRSRKNSINFRHRNQSNQSKIQQSWISAAIYRKCHSRFYCTFR